MTDGFKECIKINYCMDEQRGLNNRLRQVEQDIATMKAELRGMEKIENAVFVMQRQQQVWMGGLAVLFVIVSVLGPVIARNLLG
jgi:hypothetical protein